MTNTSRALPFILISFLSIFLSTQTFAASPKAASEKTSESSRAVFEAKASNVETYDQLVQAIRQVQAASAQRVKQEKVRLAWETGKLINEHILKNKERADYGEKVIIRLAKDLGTSETELRYMLDFARSYPIHPISDELTWSDYRELLSLNDAKEREQLAARAKKEKWDTNRIRKEIRQVNASKSGKNLPSEFLEAKPGKVGVYRVIKATAGPYAGQLALDLGFSNYLSLDSLLSRRWPQESRKGRRGVTPFKEGDLVKWNVGARSPRPGEETSPLQKASAAAFDDLYTYRAYVVKVIDGDTFTAIIDLGFEFVTEQKLRLRALDAPEIDTPEGQAAKAFVESSLRGSKSGKAEAISAPILIKTVKSDKYDRYLADVFLPLRSVKTSSSGTRATKHEYTQATYLNNELLKRKLAVRVE